MFYKISVYWFVLTMQNAHKIGYFCQIYQESCLYKQLFKSANSISQSKSNPSCILNFKTTNYYYYSYYLLFSSLIQSSDCRLIRKLNWSIWTAVYIYMSSLHLIVFFAVSYRIYPHSPFERLPVKSDKSEKHYACSTLEEHI